MFRVLFLILFASLVAIPRAQAQHEHTDAPLPILPMPRPIACGTAQPGNYCYMHDRFHDIYATLKRQNGGSCCSGSECRVTETPQEAPPQLKALGFDYLVLVDGRWCPVKSSQQQVTLTFEQRMRAKWDKHLQEFLSYSHVCASAYDGSTTSEFQSADAKSALLPYAQCKPIYCFVDGSERM